MGALLSNSISCTDSKMHTKTPWMKKQPLNFCFELLSLDGDTQEMLIFCNTRKSLTMLS